MSEGDRGWIGRALFVKKGTLRSSLKLWWRSPPYELPSSKPITRDILSKAAFPMDAMKNVESELPLPQLYTTPESLMSKGVHHHVRLVIRDLAGEHMGCKACDGTFISWDNRSLSTGARVAGAAQRGVPQQTTA